MSFQSNGLQEHRDLFPEASQLKSRVEKLREQVQCLAHETRLLESQDKVSARGVAALQQNTGEIQDLFDSTELDFRTCENCNSWSVHRRMAFHSLQQNLEQELKDFADVQGRVGSLASRTLHTLEGERSMSRSLDAQSTRAASSVSLSSGHGATPDSPAWSSRGVCVDEANETDPLIGRDDDDEEEAAYMQTIDRVQGIRRIHTSVTEAQQIFRELADLVIDNDEQLNAIDTGVRASSFSTKEAGREIHKAWKYKQSTYRRMFVLGVVATSLVFCIMIFAYWK
eukprot:GHVO01045050.1.p1 GENE.GHVO01045050.1~~GHVO01045050.1.p1  ORF type:complete len:283 (-),score=31.49 GHVO01045050.1:37-885(-)